MNHDNPASRLHAILAMGTTKPADQPCRNVWQEILGCSSVESELFARLGKVMQLPAQAEQLVASHFPHHLATLPQWRDPVQAAFLHQNLSDRWLTFQQHIPQHSLSQLALTGEILHLKLGTQAIEREALESYKNHLLELRDEVQNSDLASIAKTYLVYELEALCNALNEYAITGGGPVLKQVEAMFGHVVRDPEYRTFLASHEVGRRVFDQLTAMANVITVLVGLPQLTVGITSLLK